MGDLLIPQFNNPTKLTPDSLNNIVRSVNALDMEAARNRGVNLKDKAGQGEYNAWFIPDYLSGVFNSGVVLGNVVKYMGLSGTPAVPKYEILYSGVSGIDLNSGNYNHSGTSGNIYYRSFKSYAPDESGQNWIFSSSQGGRKDTRTVRLSGFGPSGWIGDGTGKFFWVEDTTNDSGYCWITSYNKVDGTPNSFLWARPDNIQIDWGYNKVPDGLGGFKWQSGWYWYTQVLGNSNGWKPDPDACATLPQPGATLFGIMNPDPTANPGGPYDGFDEVKYLNRSFFDDDGKILNVNRRKWKGDQYGNIVEIYEEETAFTISADEQWLHASGEGECGLEDTKLGLKLYHYSGTAYTESIPGISVSESGFTLTPYSIVTNWGQHVESITPLDPVFIPVPSGSFDNDEKVAVWASGTPGYLQDVLLAGTGIALSGQNTSALTIHCTVTPDNFKVKNDSSDPTPGFLDEKLKWDNVWLSGAQVVTGSGNYTVGTHINASSGTTSINAGSIADTASGIVYTGQKLWIDATKHLHSGEATTSYIACSGWSGLYGWWLDGNNLVASGNYYDWKGHVLSGYSQTITGTNCPT